jgi:hypothetical protein
MGLYKYLSLLVICFLSCNKLPPRVEQVLLASGHNRPELEKLIKHYQQDKNHLKLRAAYYLIENLPEQFHYEGKAVDSCTRLFTEAATTGQYFDRTHLGDSLQLTMDSINFSTLQKVYDIHHIEAGYLIDNIEEAFAAWEYPWAKQLTFRQFCEYLLPYKVKNEKPDRWRSFFRKKYSWVTDSLKNKQDYQEACTLINNDLRKWFYFTKMDFPYDPSFSDLLHLQAGRCPAEVQFTTYAMRAMGIPVAYEFVNAWANRNNGHDWNALIFTNKLIPFLGTEVDPGTYKIEYAMPGAIRSKRAKVFRKSFEPAINAITLAEQESIPLVFTDRLMKDVTREYVPVSNVSVNLQPESREFNYAFLCVFNNLTWKPVHWSVIKNDKAVFTDMGRDIVYLPVVYEDNAITPVAKPFILTKEGKVVFIQADTLHKAPLSLNRKYPVGDDNKIDSGSHYELLYWDNKWRSLGRQLATRENILFNNAPANALFWIRNLDAGLQERIFTLENNQIRWW